MDSSDWIELNKFGAETSINFLKKSTVVGVEVRQGQGYITVYIETEKATIIYARFDGMSKEVMTKARTEAQLLIAEICRSGFKNSDYNAYPPFVGELESEYAARSKNDALEYRKNNRDFPEFYLSRKG
jgi:arginyl-tRNA--protein-N-Asp/Glu arginylyltransferase